MENTKDLELFIAQVDALGEAQRGSLLNGHVISIDASGVVVDLGLKRDGIIPSEDLGRLPSEEGAIKVGDEISVMVVDPVDSVGNLVVSISQARESGDWLKAKRMMDQDEIFEAAPQSFNRGGLIVPFGRLRGFVPASHISELPRGLDESERSIYLEKLLGRTFPFKILEADPQRHRLVLSERKAIRQWRQEQKAIVIKSLKQGEIRNGVVTSLREFGAFVDIGGADGLVHISELSWEHVHNPGELLEVGQVIKTLVIRLDFEANRIGLSIKRLQPNPWDSIADKIKLGQLLEGKVTRQTSSGIYINVEKGIEGFVRTTVEYTLPPVGSKVQVRVLAFDPKRERMNLELILMNEELAQSASLEDIQS